MSTVERIMMQCKRCRCTWSVDPGDVGRQRCGCGGELDVFDLAAHAASLPHVPYDHKTNGFTAAVSEAKKK